MVIFAGFVIWYIINIQFVEGQKWRSLSDSLTMKYKVIQAARGNIYSDNGTLLATSVPRYELRLDAMASPIDTFNKYMPILARLFSENFKDKTAREYLKGFQKARKTQNRYYFIKRKLNFLEIKEVKNWPLFKKGRFRSGLIIEVENHRVLPFHQMLTRTIGYANKGKTKTRVGLEGAFDKELAGISGKRLMRKISGGYRPVNDVVELEPEEGKDIYTTINVDAQDIVNKALLKGLTKHQAHHGCAVVMEVKTGEIKAIANLSIQKDGSYQETFNYAVAESYEPGSTFKLISAMALLSGKHLTVSDSVFVNKGSLQFNGVTMNDAEYCPFKNQTFSYAFEHSSNVGISSTVNKYYGSKPLDFIQFLKQINLHQNTGVEIPGEIKPYIKEPQMKSWSSISLPWMSIGYDLRFTPLQILNVYNAVANDGKMVKPYLVKAIGNKGIIEKKIEPIILNESIADEEVIKDLRKLLRGVVEHGTARTLLKSKVEISGKTGTSQIADGKGYTDAAYFSSFAGYFPSGQPKYSVIIVINKPKEKGYYGAVVAAPIVQEIAEKMMGMEMRNAIDIPDTVVSSGKILVSSITKKGPAKEFFKKFDNIKASIPKSESEWVFVKNGEKDSYLFTDQENKNSIPDLTGMGLRDVLYLLENKGVKVSSIGKGKVIWQSVKAGTEISKVSTIQIKLSL